MRVCVTGSSGFIGKAVQVELTLRNHEVVKYDKPHFDIIEFDAGFIREFRIDAVINLAGMLGTPELFGSEWKAAKTNILGAINVYDAASVHDIPVVQIGTGHKGQPNPYAITKGCAEDLGLARAQWMGEKINVVRAYHVYGPGQAVGPPHGTASVHKFFPTFATRALTNMSLELCGTGAQLIDPVYVTDCASVLVDAIDGPYGQVLEAGNGAGGFTVRRIAEDIHDAVNSRSDLIAVDSRDGEPYLSHVVAERPLCNNPWPYMVADTAEWYRQWLASRLSQ